MSADARNALHEVHTATNDVLEGYRVMRERAEAEILPMVIELTQVHQRHAQEQEREIQRLGESGSGDTSVQGTVNKAAVIVRDWYSGLDRDVLSAVRQGEEALRDRYVGAMQRSGSASDNPIGAMLQQQHAEICGQIARLPKA